MGIDRHRTEVFETAFFQFLRNDVGKAVADRNPSFPVSGVQNGFVSCIRPDPFAEGTEFLPHLPEAPGIVDHSFNFMPGSDHPLGIHDAVDIFLREFRNLVIIKTGKALPEDFPFFDHQGPAEAALHGFHHQVLKHHAVIMDRHPPFRIMVGPHGFKCKSPFTGTHMPSSN